jgi:hypothetical protein
MASGVSILIDPQRCAGNELWCDFFFTMQPGIPYNRANIMQLSAHSFNEPAKWTGTTIIYVPDLDYDPMQHQGALKALSPEEVRFARILGVAKAR